MSRRTNRTAKKRAAFLTALGAGNSIAAACQMAGIPRASAYEWRDSDDDFRTDWDDAIEDSIDLLEDEARRRAMGQSDLLLIFLLRHRRPQVYRPPPRAMIAAVDPQVLRDHEEAERLRNTPTEELEREIERIERQRAAVSEARDWRQPQRSNGADHDG